MTAKILPGLRGKLSLTVALLLIWNFSALSQNCSQINFTANITRVCAPDSVIFQATGLPQGSSCYWYLGSGPFFPGGNIASIIYTTPGTYTISLLVRLPNGILCDTIVKKDYIKVFVAPKPVLVTSTNLLCDGSGSVQFTDNTAGSVSSSWVVDGKSNDKRTFTHFFSSPGLKDVTLTITDANNCRSSLTKPGLIKVVKPSETDFCMDATVTKADITANIRSVVKLNGNNVSSYAWSFPGGNPSSSSLATPPAVKYSDVTKRYDVSLALTTTEGCVHTFKRTDYMQKFLSISSDRICLKDVVHVTNMVNSDGRMDFEMDFSIKKFIKQQAEGTVIMEYPANGVYDLVFKFKYGIGKCENTVSFPDYLTVIGPNAKFIVPERLACDAPFTARLWNVSTVGAGTSNTFTWTISDSKGIEVPGSPIIMNSIRDTFIVFTKKGKYSVQLKVISSDGCMDIMDKGFHINIESPEGSFFASKTNVCIGEEVEMTEVLDPPDVGSTPYIYEWLFTNSDSPAVTKAVSGKSPTVMFTVPGVYHVRLILKTGNNCADTIIHEHYIRVKGIVANIIIKGSGGCIPYTTQASADIITNVPSTPQNKIFYKWEVWYKVNEFLTIQADDEAEISNPDASSTTIIFKKSGCYSVKLILRNSDGCTTLVERKNIVCIGVIADFKTGDNFCRNSSINLYDSSQLNPTYFRWYSTPSAGVSFHPSDAAINPTVKFDRDAVFKITHVVGRMVNNQMCLDSITREINILVLSANFIIYDSIQYCAPVIVDIVNKSVGGINYVWDFGDGTGLESPLMFPSHGYTTNNADGFIVKMVAFSNIGCRDSVSRRMRIIGPMPGFLMDGDRFCGTGSVSFTNTSKNTISYVFDYGDSRTDTNQILPHTFNFIEQGTDSTVYKVVMLAKDGFCPDPAIFRDTVIVYRPAAATISSDKTSGCPPLEVTFTDQSKASANRRWDFNKDGVTDATAKVTTYEFPPGIHDVKLFYTSKYGCSDSVVKPGYIHVDPYPKGDFKKTSNAVCPGDTIFFQALNTNPDARVYWDFGDPSIMSDTAQGIFVQYKYQNPGKYTVKIRIVEAGGCVLDVSKKDLVYIPNNLPPPVPVVNYVSVVNNNAVLVSWGKLPYPEFRKYHLYRSSNGPEMLVYSTTDKNDTTFTEDAANVIVDQNIYTYTLWIENNCGQRTPGITHNSILLKVGITPANTHMLSWNAYNAWPGSVYNVYRSKNGGSFEKIGSTQNLFYPDNDICDFGYCYYVEAGTEKSPYQSISNTSCNHPVYIYQTMPLALSRTTVEGNVATLSFWEKGIQPNVKEYIVERFERVKGWQQRYSYSEDTAYTDVNVLVNREYYRYRVSVLDKCMNISPVSNIGTSILLRSQIFQDKVLLNWNSYVEWSNGVAGYKLQLRDKNHIFRTIKEFKATDTTYTDPELHKDLDTAFCYRIIAYEMGPDPDSSVSNVSCAILPSRMFIPNAFTPNDDGLNDVFNVTAISIFNLTGASMTDFELKIYNRWGSLIFQSNDINKGWDGTFNGKPVPVGVYMYTVAASGLDHTDYNLGGTVTLLR
jgi:gliding motility-associated-like protein